MLRGVDRPFSVSDENRICERSAKGRIPVESRVQKLLNATPPRGASTLLRVEFERIFVGDEVVFSSGTRTFWKGMSTSSMELLPLRVCRT